MKKSIIFSILFLSITQSSWAQINKVNQFHTWYNYTGNFKLDDKHSLQLLYSFRRNGLISAWQQSLLRVGLNYKINDHFTFTPGYDWALLFPYGKQPISAKSNDHRIFEQFSLKNKVGQIYVSHRYRVEQRFIEHGSNYNFRNRFRYRLSLIQPINKTELGANTLYLKVFNETFVNYGPGIGNHYFDQNWAFAGLGFKYDRSTSFSLGYMSQYLVKVDNIKVENNHTLIVSFAHNIDFIRDDN